MTVHRHAQAAPSRQHSKPDRCLDCSLCACRVGNRDTWIRRPAAERTALRRTGMTGEVIGGLPVISAVLIPWRGWNRMYGMARAGWVDFDTPSFLCPWSAADYPPVLVHGPAWRADSGESEDLDLDARGLFRRATHCAGLKPSLAEYYVRPFTVDGLKRRLII